MLHKGPVECLCLYGDLAGPFNEGIFDVHMLGIFLFWG